MLALNPSRFDITAKTIFGRAVLDNNESQFPRMVYEEHLRVWNGFFENSPRKETKEDFLESFEQILKAHRDNKFVNAFSKIPMSPTGNIANGSHRIASAILQNRKVVFEKATFNQPEPFNFAFFRDRGLSDNILDSMTLEYIRLSTKNLHMLLLYPHADQDNQAVIDIIESAGTVVREKTITVPNSGAINFIHQTYFGEKWASTTDQFSLIRKTVNTFGSGKGPHKVRAVLVEVEKPRTGLLREKQEIRKRFQSHHFVHTTDTKRECDIVSRMVFNANSLSFVSKRNLSQLTPRFDELFKDFDAVAPHEDRCIDSGGVLAAYGIRDVGGDLDYLYRADGLHPRESPGGISNHLSQSPFFTDSIDEILTNPGKHFFYLGHKFATLEVVRNMKKTRNESKDTRDILLIDKFLSK